MSRWVSYRKMEPADRQILLVVSTLLPLVAALIRCLGFRRTFSFMSRFAGEESVGSVAVTTNQSRSLIRMKQTMRIIKIKGLFRGNCLSRSLLLWLLLRRRQIPCTLVFGTRIRGGEFQAHAWVEKDFIPINASPNVRKNYRIFEYDFESAKLRPALSN